MFAPQSTTVNLRQRKRILDAATAEIAKFGNIGAHHRTTGNEDDSLQHEAKRGKVAKTNGEPAAAPVNAVPSAGSSNAPTSTTVKITAPVPVVSATTSITMMSKPGQSSSTVTTAASATTSTATASSKARQKLQRTSTAPPLPMTKAIPATTALLTAPPPAAKSRATPGFFSAVNAGGSTGRKTHDINALKDVGFSDADVQKLVRAGFVTLETIAHSPIKRIAEIHGVSQEKAEKLMREAIKIIECGFRTAGEVLKERNEIKYITTGSSKLDALLGGGIESGSITELYGDIKTGKSQLCMQLSVTGQLPEGEGGAGGMTVFIDSAGRFRTERIIQISDSLKMDSRKVLDNIKILRTYNTDQQLKALDTVTKMMTEERYSLLVVDSATALYRTDYGGRGELSERQQHLGKFLRKLHEIASQFNVAVIITNEVTAQVDGMALLGDPKIPIGGHVMAHATTTRLSLKKGSGEKRYCHVINSPSLPPGSCTFGILQHGIGDVADD